jgi:hypothetical protein
VTRLAEDREAEGFGHPVEPRQLHDEFVGHLFPRDLVVGVEHVAERRILRVEHDGRVGRMHRRE